MIIDKSDPAHVGKRYKITDANGESVGSAIRVDTETGEVLRYKRRPDGRGYQLNKYATGIETERVFLPPPFKVEEITSFVFLD